MAPTREIYWNISGQWIMYAMFVVVLAVFCWGVYRRVRLWRLGQPENRRENMWARFMSVVTYTLGHKRIIKEGYPGFMHLGIFWGFISLLIGTSIIVLHIDLGIPIFVGNFYLGLSLIMDVLGIASIIGIGMAMFRRYILRPDRLDNKENDWISLTLLMVILVTGFLLEGLRIAGTGDPWAAWSPGGKAIALLFSGWTSASIIQAFQWLWWGHLILAFAFIAYIPYSKLFHMLGGPLNQFFRKLEPQGNIAPIDFEDESLESYGIDKVQDFTWKQLMDADVCLSCGRCQDNCPAHLTQKPLSPNKLGQDIKEQLYIEGGKLLAAKAAGKEGEQTDEAAVEADKALIGEVVDKDAIWACTTCRSCETQCPIFVEHVNRIIEMRRYLTLMESEFPAELKTIFRNMENNSNPWGVGWSTRADWAKNLGVNIMAEVDADEVEYLYWVGCAGSFDDRNKRVATAVVKLLQKAGVKFAILGTEEQCCGDSAKQLGNENLYQTVAMTNIENMNNYNVKKIITACPHCYNTLKNDYPKLGGTYQVVHHTELLQELIASGRLSPAKQARKVVYHDPCYIGRYNDVYDEPRQVLGTTVNMLEMERNRERSFCCGAGGGRMWLEEQIGTRINQTRAAEASKTGADIIATACPYCLIMMGDGTKLNEDDIPVLDLAEILAEGIEPAKINKQEDNNENNSLN